MALTGWRLQSSYLTDCYGLTVLKLGQVGDSRVSISLTVSVTVLVLLSHHTEAIFRWQGECWHFVY